LFIKTKKDLVHSLERLGKAAWLRLTPTSVHFIIIPESHTGTQVWSYVPLPRVCPDIRNLNIEMLFENDYICQSKMENMINLEIPLDTLHRALKSCSSAADTTLRLTKKDNNAYLALASAVAVYPFLNIDSREKGYQQM
jgi:HUS1 checkpoint protein